MSRPVMSRASVLVLVEAGMVLFLGRVAMVRIPDLTPLFFHFFDMQAGPPDFAMADPFYPLLRGVLGLCLFFYLVRLLVLSKARSADGVPGRDWLLNALIAVFLLLAIVPSVARDMFDRATYDDISYNTTPFRSRTHDGGVLQTELAAHAVLAGENPYAIDYGDTDMARAGDSNLAGWQMFGYERNPALGHVPYMPVSFLLPIPLMKASEAAFGWYDQRIFYILAALLFVWVAGRLVDPGMPRRVVWLLAGLNPMLLPFLKLGRNDIVILAMLALVALALKHRRLAWAGLILGLACATKHLVWPVAFFYVVWLFSDPSIRGASARRATLAVVLAFVIPCLPFMIADAGAFFDDTIAFNFGLSPDAYPLRPDSPGMASLVLGMGWANELRGGFPMWVFQVGVTLPLTVIATMRLIRCPRVSEMFAAAALIVFSALFFAAHFAFNYWAVPFFLLLFGVAAASWSPVQQSE